MHLRSSLAIVCVPLIAAAAACGAGSSGPDGSGGSGAGAAAVPQARSSLPRQPASKVPQAAVAAAVAANNAFAVDLYGHVLAGGSAGASNLITSPLSASLALTMTYAGAKGQTATEMATALHLGAGGETLFDGQNALSQAIDARAATALAGDQQTAKEFDEPAPSPSNYQLDVVNSVWGQKSYTWAPPFLDVLAQDYGTGVYLVDFAGQYEDARTTINGWVSTKTSDKINGLLPEGSITPDTRMVLVNAIHLKLAWASAFDPGATAPALFTKADGTSVSTAFMNQTSTFSYTDDGDAQIIALPLEGGQLSIVVALPHGDLSTYEAGLTAGSAALALPGQFADVALSLPKVGFTSPTFSLSAALTAMGMPDAFGDAADFTGMCAHPPDGVHLQITDVLQKTFLDMAETGVEAAAATAVVLGETGAATGGPPPTPVPMVVNRPFLTAIVDVPTGAILFLGHIEDPSDAWGS
jgi:serpin B